MRWTWIFACLGIVAPACRLDTDLEDEITRGAPPIADVALVQPTPGAGEVPPNLAAIVVRFAPSRGTGAALRVSGAAGDLDLAAPPAGIPCVDAGTCVRWPLPAALTPSATYRVAVVDAGRVDALGVFTTAPAADQAPPQILEATVALSGSCVVVHFRTDESAEALAIVRAGGREVQLAGAAPGVAFEIAGSVSSLPAGQPGDVVAVAIDAAGNRSESAPMPLTTPPSLPALAITEVLANPAGVEPAQEFVEIENIGGEELAVGGLRIADPVGADTLPSGTLAPGAFALIVSSTFDERSARDVPVRAGTLLLRVDSRIGGDGLGNGGDPVALRTAEGAEISRYGGWVDVSGSSWSGRSVERIAPAACDGAASWNRQPLPPTPGW